MAGKTNCGVCGKLGHNARTCPNKKQAAKKKAAKKAKPHKRTRKGTFAKGNKGGGRTKEQTKARESLREYIRGKIEIDDRNVVIDQLLHWLEDGGAKDSIWACTVLLEYCYGKPPTVAEIDASSDDGESGQVLIIGGTEIRF